MSTEPTPTRVQRITPENPPMNNPASSNNELPTAVSTMNNTPIRYKIIGKDGCWAWSDTPAIVYAANGMRLTPPDAPATPSPTLDTDESEVRARWLHEHGAPKDWGILTLSEIAAIKAEFQELRRERDEARREIDAARAQIEAWKNTPVFAIAEQDATLRAELDERDRRLEEQHKLYCEETKRHNATWAKIHAAMAYLNKEFKKLPEDLIEAVKEVTFRCALVEMGRDKLRAELAEAKRDTERLDWLLAQNPEIWLHNTPFKPAGEAAQFFLSHRAALDHARKNGGAK